MPVAPHINLSKRAQAVNSPRDEAVGIPRRHDVGRVEQGLRPDQLVKYVLQHHETARRPGRPHLDLRLGTPETGLYSWALPRAQLPRPREKRLAPQTEVHNYGYGDFTGRIGNGYGKGVVTMADNGQALITKVTPNSINFTVAHAKNPQRFSLVKLPADKVKSSQPQWLLIGVPAGKNNVPGVGTKPTYRLISAADSDEAIAQASQVQAKIDGAHAVYDIDDTGKLEAYSVRPSVTGAPIVHTERLGLSGQYLPKELRGTTLRGEIFGTDSAGGVKNFSEISGFLNKTLKNSVESTLSGDFRPNNALFGVERHNGQRFDGDPDAQRALLETLLPKLPAGKFTLPDVARTPEEKRRLIAAIRAGTHPQTREGAVLHVGGQRVKYKLRPETTAYLRGTYPPVKADGRRQGLAGGITASLAANGEPSLRIGTGFTDKQLADIVRNLKEYQGRPIRVEHQGEFPSGLLRAPSFKGFEVDKAAGSLKKAQWKVPSFSSDHVETLHGAGLRPQTEKDLQTVRNAFWANRIYREPEDPVNYDTIKREEPPQKDFYVNLITPGGNTLRVNVEALARDLGIHPTEAGMASSILPSGLRVQLHTALRKLKSTGDVISKAVPVAQL